MKILITRPIDESIELAEKLIALGHETIIYPLTEIIIAKNIDLPKAEGYIVTSRNAVKAISSYVIDKPIFIVGQQTTDFAKSLGFKKAVFAGKNVEELKEKITALYPRMRLIYLSGEDVTDDLMDFTIARKILYHTNPIQLLTEDFQLALAKTQLILFFSSSIAKIFIDFVNNNELQLYCRDIYALTLSAKIADILNKISFKAIEIAKQPTQESVLDLVKVLNERKK